MRCLLIVTDVPQCSVVQIQSFSLPALSLCFILFTFKYLWISYLESMICNTPIEILWSLSKFRECWIKRLSLKLFIKDKSYAFLSFSYLHFSPQHACWYGMFTKQYTENCNTVKGLQNLKDWLVVLALGLLRRTNLQRIVALDVIIIINIWLHL